ncbi:MAG: extracellular solute-binding protein, partial [bacterium]
YSEVVSFAKKITQYGAAQDPKKYGFALPLAVSDVWEYYADMPLSQAGIYHFNYDTLKYEFYKQKPILEMYIQLDKDGSIFPGALQLDNDPARAQFSEGNIGMMMAASWDVGVFNDQFPAKIDWGVARFPTPDGKLSGKSVLDAAYDSLYVNGMSSPEVQKAAVRFLEFITSVEEQVKYYEGGYGIATMSDIVAASKNPSQKKGIKEFTDLSNDDIYPRWPPEVELEGDDRYTVYNAILAGRLDLDEGLKDLDKRLNDALKQAAEQGKFKLEDYRIAGWTPTKPNPNAYKK